MALVEALLQEYGGGTLFHDHQFIWKRKVAPF